MSASPSPPFRFHSESGDEAPSALCDVDDGLRADDALTRARRGEHLRYTGTFENAKQLLGALGRRLPAPPRAATLAEAFRAERRARQQEHQLLSRLVVSLDPDYRLELERAPEVAVACEQALGPARGERTVLALKTLLGMLGAAEWRRKGLVVPGLKGRLTPHYGVYSPTRAEYVELVSRLDGVAGATVFDVGTGTGVLSFVLLQRGAARAVGTDVEPRAAACATANAARLGLADRFSVVERPLFPEGLADLVVCNPPWIPSEPKTRVDRAIFDEGGAVLGAFLSGLRAHLAPGGRGALVLSDLAVHLGLREQGALEAAVASAGLVIEATTRAAARHGKAKDADDPLHAARSREVTSLYALRAA